MEPLEVGGVGREMGDPPVLEAQLLQRQEARRDRRVRRMLLPLVLPIGLRIGDDDRREGRLLQLTAGDGRRVAPKVAGQTALPFGAAEMTTVNASSRITMESRTTPNSLLPSTGGYA